jgi:hypothetical protein
MYSTKSNPMNPRHAPKAMGVDGTPCVLEKVMPRRACSEDKMASKAPVNATGPDKYAARRAERGVVLKKKRGEKQGRWRKKEIHEAHEKRISISRAQHICELGVDG